MRPLFTENLLILQFYIYNFIFTIFIFTFNW
jgi:hypothetical protein